MVTSKQGRLRRNPRRSREHFWTLEPGGKRGRIANWRLAESDHSFIAILLLHFPQSLLFNPCSPPACRRIYPTAFVHINRSRNTQP